MIEYNLIREIECGEPCLVFSGNDLTKTARVAIDYSQLGEIKLGVKIDGRYATFDELEVHTRLIEKKIEELASRVQ